MTADLLFGNVEFFGAPSGQRIRVKVGEDFGVKFNDAPEGWSVATTADPILDVRDGEVTKVAAMHTGTSEIQIQVDRDVVFYITVEVFNPDEATTLGTTAGSPEPK